MYNIKTRLPNLHETGVRRISYYRHLTQRQRVNRYFRDKHVKRFTERVRVAVWCVDEMSEKLADLGRLIKNFADTTGRYRNAYSSVPPASGKSHT